MEPSTLPLVLHVFDKHYDAGKVLFEELSKKLKSKKSIELESHLEFFRVYIQLLERVHFNKKREIGRIFTPFKELHKNLRKVKHIRFIQDGYITYMQANKHDYPEYEKLISSDKHRVYSEVYELILSIPLQKWEDLYRNIWQYSKGMSILSINTAINQIINEEVEFFNFGTKTRLDAQTISEIYKGLKKVTVLEKIRLAIGLNSIFTHKVHQEIDLLVKEMVNWHKNQLLLQHLGSHLGKKEDISKKYQTVLAFLQKNHKELTKDIDNRCQYLFTKMLN
ncbi:hypothetical protein [Cyclobacterium amurskyense]|jgi:hypothetical protein|uniref:Uncharacterized protein n=1 Tax=Cyclobacterium amurskyense TaxID=320787 RepID=A0A0H4P785_9BACT|nr:hypothetical protein [Cyclobacterium amurskyense]AKP50321.1 hypothetical protein CA2015_0863 [Cyclobacterium amurskyense]|tara:strand:- start:18039 stop:18875 length:837 start_codon:yes stop_codon:yes gene_type:complete